MQELVTTINDFVWGKPLVYLCLGAGLIFSILTRFVQVRLFREMLRLLFSSKASDTGISSFQALAVSLSGRVGTGNIAGVAAAIGFGGPGAIFWMWVVAFLGSATAYVESALGQIYKEVDEGEYRGGPAFYIEKAMGQKWYAWIFAVSTIIATGLLLPGVQSNAIGNAAAEAFGNGQIVNSWVGEIASTKLIAAVVVVSVLGFIIFGGVKRIAHFTQVVVPFMALGYIVSALAIVAMNITMLPEIIGLILSEAFTVQAVTGGAVFWGVKRGIFSNEAGQGTGPHAAAASEVEHPAQQGLVQAFSVYIDTLFVCTATAFMILITKAYNVVDVVTDKAGQSMFVPREGFHNVDAMIDPNTPSFTQLAVESAFPGVGKPFVAIALFFFAFTTLLAYYYIAETNVAYLRRFFKVPGELVLLKLLLMGSVFYGAVRTASLAWGMGEIGVGLMAWLNIVAILILFFMGQPALRALWDYERQRKEGVSKYTFDPEKLGIRNADFWRK
ncbi:MAG: alanine/glycine:cation symporter family protein [Woeseiaceae bacterium]|nr:alanine/glycine:cation symporter family protein [Woeseiaceae bacterium]